MSASAASLDHRPFPLGNGWIATSRYPNLTAHSSSLNRVAPVSASQVCASASRSRMSMRICQYGTPRFRSVVLYWPAQAQTWSYIRRCRRRSHASRATDSGRSRRRERNSHVMAWLMFSASALFSSLRVSTGNSSPWRSSSAGGVPSSGSSSGSLLGTSAPQAASFDQLLGKPLLHLPRFACRLVLKSHRLLGGGYLPVGQLAGSFAYNRGQRPTRYEQIDKIAAERIGGAAQCFQTDPVSGFRLFEPGHCPCSRT